MNLEDKMSQTYQLTAVNQGLKKYFKGLKRSTAFKLEATV